MALHTLRDFDPDFYDDRGSCDDMKGFDVYTHQNNKVGSVADILVDDTGRCRYFVVNTSGSRSGDQVLLPVGQSRIDTTSRRLYTDKLGHRQVESLPAYHSTTPVDHHYEERVRSFYRMPTVEESMPVESSVPVESDVSLDAPAPTQRVERRPAPEVRTQPVPPVVPATPVVPETYSYESEPDLYQLNERDHQPLRLLEERLIANKHRRKRGTVVVGKHVETETQNVAVPVNREHVVVERSEPTTAGAVSPDTPDFQSGQVAHMDVYEETADIRKEPRLYEETSINKVVEQENINRQETVRREELDVDVDRTTDVEQRSRRVPRNPI